VIADHPETVPNTHVSSRSTPGLEAQYRPISTKRRRNKMRSYLMNVLYDNMLWEVFSLLILEF
jgi:hypothetical protein